MTHTTLDTLITLHDTHYIGHTNYIHYMTHTTLGTLITLHDTHYIGYTNYSTCSLCKTPIIMCIRPWKNIVMPSVGCIFSTSTKHQLI